MRHQVRSFGVCLIALGLLLGSTELVWSGDRDHEGGFFMRLSAGGGSARTEISEFFDKAEFSGPTGDVNFAFGGIVSPNLAVHGTLFGWLISDPTVELNGTDLGEVNADLQLFAIGAGITYYFMPANVYVSGSIGFGTLELDGSGENAETDGGLVADVSAGKEWWVGNSWAIGVAAGIGLHSLADKDINENWSGTSFAVRFTATKN